MLKRYSNQIVAGCDEAGRGCLAGPVFAASVILPPDYKNKILNDSKVLTLAKRNLLRIDIEKNALSWAVAKVSPGKIDKINILNASFLAMHKAIDKLTLVPEILIIDGNRFNSYKRIDHDCIIKGDGIYLSIAAASVLAKTHRDEYMIRLGKKHPLYLWKNNKGYPTKAHRDAIAVHGHCNHHRMSFRLLPLPEQKSLF